MSDKAHLLLLYKGDISALTLFCQWPEGGICFPPLPKLSAIVEEEDLKPEVHELFPKKLLNSVNEALELDDDILEIVPEYFQQVEQPDGLKTVYMARFKLLDPPHDMLAKSQCKLQTLTELIGRSPTEMELLRRAYTLMMEG